MTSSIRVRITAIAVLAVAVTLLLAAAALVQWQRQALTQALDERLADRADAVQALMLSGESSIGGSSVEAFAQLVAPDGDVLAGTQGLESDALPLPAAGPRDSYRTVTSLPVDDDSFRVLIRPVTDGSLYIGTTYDVVHESTSALLRGLTFALPLVLLMLGLVVWWLVGRTLRPVEAIRLEVAEIGAGKLDRRVPQSASKDEVGRLARTMNQMLDRLQGAARRQEQFTGDAAHELRSPLARMQAALEVERSSDGLSWQQTSADVHEDVHEMQRLVDDLLYLARTDEGATAPSLTPLDLDDVVLREVQRVTPGVTIDATGVSGAHVLGEASSLARLVRNLLDNAVRHARARVTLTLVEHDGLATLTVTDDGPGIADADRERIFERFARADVARSVQTGGTGLGLAIARDIAERHGGCLTLLPSAAGAVFELRLPAAALRS